MRKTFTKLFNSLGGPARTAFYKNLDDDIRAGKYANYSNTTQVMDAFINGALLSEEFVQLIIILSKHLSKESRKKLTDAFVKNPAFYKKYSGKTERQFRETLGEKGWSDDVIEDLVISWKEEGNIFLNRVASFLIKPEYVIKLQNLLKKSPMRFLSEFGKYVVQTSFGSSPFWRLVTSIPVLLRFKGSRFIARIGKDSLHRIGMWIVSGQTLLPKEISVAFKKNGFLGVAGAWGGNIVGNWIRISFWLTVGNVLIEIIKDWGKPNGEYEAKTFIMTAIYRVWDDKVGANFRYFIPILNIDTLMEKWLNPLMAGDLESVVASTREEADELYGKITPQTNDEQELLNILTDQQYSKVSKTERGTYYYFSEDYPIKNINGLWCVYVPNKGWYDIKDIE
jgi:hypothetical protein